MFTILTTTFDRFGGGGGGGGTSLVKKRSNRERLLEHLEYSSTNNMPVMRGKIQRKKKIYIYLTL